ncbi:hypothetical protein [Actinopolymorpha pittospori]|uniref:Uncharacterized protein n=1 Tax=Actinopolymorpha pittospori TaxID=648752 RepID=A0A927N019_9ACTN|nr:hypothetical protein [Actinopolymorpha pittospori]MBE1606235.1 hypothetical protein [Actinopolymorpha pittospori]
MATKTRAALESDAVRILRGLRSLGEGDRERRTMLMRDLSETLVNLREHFLTKDGTPDWAGRAWAYRRLVRDLYGEAGIPPEDATPLQAASRYHIGNILRERLKPEELEDLGLGPGPRERVRAAHEERSNLLATLKGDGENPEVIRAFSVAFTLLERVSDEAVAELRGADRRAARTLLRKIAERAEQLRTL